MTIYHVAFLLAIGDIALALYLLKERQAHRETRRRLAWVTKFWGVPHA